MLPYQAYHSVVAKNDFVTTMITSRGCPYKCTFCKLSFQKVLSRSANDVLAEMETIAALGIREIEVYDDTFTWSNLVTSTGTNVGFFNFFNGECGFFSLLYFSNHFIAN